MLCRRCNAELDKGQIRCDCGAWTFDSSNAIASETVFFEDIEDQDLPRISLGVMDHCLGGGIVKSDVALIAGPPGSGKSTLLLQITECIMQHGTCLYIASEEDIRTIKSRAKRLGVKIPPKRLAFVRAMGGGADIGNALAENKPAGFIIDSLDGLVGRDGEAELKALDIVKKFSVMLNAPAIVISQVNKELDYSGLMAKQHHVDVLLMLTPDPELKTSNGEAVRILETQQKNRNGRAFVETFLEMSATGLRALKRKELLALGVGE